MADNTLFSRLAALKNRADGVHPVIIGALLLILFLSLTLPTYNFTSGGGDTGEYLNNPVRILHGDLPYKDFWLLFPPGEVYLPALLYMIFGINANVVLTMLVVASALTGLAAFAVGRQIFGDNVLSTVAAIMVFFSFTAVYMLFLLVAAFFLIRFFRADTEFNLALAGISAGMAFLFRFHEVGAALLAFVVAIVVFFYLRRNLAAAIRKVAILCICAVVTPVVFVLPLFSIWPQMLYQVTIQTVMQGTEMGLPYFQDYHQFTDMISSGLSGFIGNGGLGHLKDAAFYLFQGISVYTLYLLPAVVVIVSAFYLTGKKQLSDMDYAIILTFALWGVFTFPKAMWRADMTHLAQAITPMFFAVMYMARAGLSRQWNGLSRYVPYALALVVLIIFLHSLLMAKAAAAAVLSQQPRSEVSTNYGTLSLDNEAEAQNINDTIAYIEGHTKEGDYIFVTPWNSAPLYELTGRKDPTYYDSLIDLAARPSVEKQKEVIRELQAKDTKLIVSDPDWAIDNNPIMRFSTVCYLLEQYIENNYTQVASYGEYLIYVPKGNTGQV